LENLDPFDFSRFFEQAPDGIFFMDPDSLIVLEAPFLSTKEEKLRKTWFDGF
jgi:hypothetical protein